MKCSHLILLAGLVYSFAADASRRNQEEAPPPQIYKERVKAMLDQLVVDEVVDSQYPLTPEQEKQIQDALRSADAFQFDAVKDIEIKNHKIPLSLTSPGIPVVKLGHTFTTNLIFTDVAGNPWTVEMLTDISDTDVVSVSKKAPNIISVRPKKRAGKTNLPVKLVGEQRPITFLFDISDTEVYFDVDIQVDAMGDNSDSQKTFAIANFNNRQSVSPRLNLEPAKALLLQFMTPEGYEERKLFNEHRERIDPRDFTAWSKGDSLYVVTPHGPYSPDPNDIIASPDGRHILMEFKRTPVIAVRKNGKIFWLHVE